MIALIMLIASANAADSAPVYFVGSEEVSVSEALTRALGGQQVMRCVPVEAKPSKSGTSITLRTVKKSKGEK